MRRPTPRILFLQLPRLENDTRGEQENLPMAAFYLQVALERAAAPAVPPVTGRLETGVEDLDDTRLLEKLTAWHPDVVCATLYLWNIERTLSLLRQAKRRLPHLQALCGGPEVAPGHPFLFKSRIPDVAVSGEGEALLPRILEALETGRGTDFERVAWKGAGGYVWGTKPAPLLPLGQALPPARHPGWRPDARGMAYLETGRGCPMGCSYCRYSQMRAKTTYIGMGEVLERVRVLKDRGARQIRFVDPTFNANPAFRDLLKGLQALNPDREIRFFAELQADRLSADEIGLLAEAGFSEVEAGVQSLDARVLKKIHRPMRPARMERNIHGMTRNGIGVTIDLMYGLPGQDLKDALDSLRWAWAFKGAHVQSFQTLLLPGTELRKERGRWGLKADPRPPYGVLATDSLSPEDIRRIEAFMNRRQASDGMARRFVGVHLPDLFQERCRVSPGVLEGGRGIPGKSARRALVFEGEDLFSLRAAITGLIRRALEAEPHMLWQFVLKAQWEEPLDLLDLMIHEIRRHEPHWIDRFACTAGWDRIASRRVFVLLKRGRSFEADWRDAAERLLEDAFY